MPPREVATSPLQDRRALHGLEQHSTRGGVLDTACRATQSSTSTALQRRRRVPGSSTRGGTADGLRLRSRLSVCGLRPSSRATSEILSRGSKGFLQHESSALELLM